MDTQEEDTLRDAEVHTQNKNVTAMWLIILTQVIFCVMSMYLDVEILDQQYGSVALQQFFYTGLLIILVVVGFGLTFGFIGRLGWSSVGFNLLITALCTQFYFFMQVFWVKAQLQQKDRTFSTYENNTISFDPSDASFGDMNEALKCSLAIIVAFSSILGRAGILEAYILSIFGTIVYELSRQVLLNVTDLQLGSGKIFLYGGTIGAVCSLMLSRRETPIKQNRNYVCSTNSTTTSLLGLLIVWVLFPLLARDEPFPNSDQTNNLRVINIALSLATSTVVGAAFAFTDFGFKAFIAFSLSGGIAGLSSAPFITNPAYAIATGFIAACIQSTLSYFFLAVRQKHGPIDGGLSFVFFFQGLVGVIIVSINKAIINLYSNGVVYDQTDKKSDAEFGIAAGLIPCAMGLIIGLVLGYSMSLLTYHDSEDHFTDCTYWKQEDEICTHSEQTPSLEKQSQQQFQLQERTSKVKQKRAYL